MTEADLQFDRYHLWHPYTSLSKPLPVYPVVSAEGVYLQLSDGRRLVDGMSSWWTAIHGYQVPELNEAARQQLDKMSHVMFGGITHEPAIALGQQLLAVLPPTLDRIFLADTGSVAVEVAMKVAVQYQHALGYRGRNKFMTIQGGYHGDTSGAMAVCDPEGGMHRLFADFLPQHFFAPRPSRRFHERYTEEDEAAISRFVAQHARQCAAFILEPIVQGAGGMYFYSPDLLRILRRLCDAHGLLLICDEIATAFGRSGRFFASEHAAVVPDILCIGKALTGGYLTLAATICSSAVAEVLGKSEAGVLMHGPTFMGNPLACAIAAKSTELLLASPWQKRVQAISGQLQAQLAPLADHPQVKDVRVLGAIGVVETQSAVDVAAAQAFFVARGVWIRPFRHLLYIMPPYIIQPDELSQLTQAIQAYVFSLADKEG